MTVESVEAVTENWILLTLPSALRSWPRYRRKRMPITPELLPHGFFVFRTVGKSTLAYLGYPTATRKREVAPPLGATV